MNQFALSGNRSKPSIANIIGFCGFALLAITDILQFICYFNFDSGSIGIVYAICGFLTLVANLAIGCFFVMDMISQKGNKKILDVFGLVAVALFLTAMVRIIVFRLNVEQYSIEEIQAFQIVNLCINFSGIFLLCLFFSGFNENVRLRIPSACVLSGEVIGFSLYFWAGFAGLGVVGQIVSFLTGGAMVWFMYEYMRQPQDNQIEGAPDTNSAFLFRIIGTLLCAGVGLAALYMPFIDIKFFGNHAISLYDLFQFAGRGDVEAMRLKMLMFIYIPATLFYIASIIDKDIVKPIIALLMTLIPIIGLLDLDAHYNGGIAFFVLLYVALIGVTIKVVADARQRNYE